jgi:hypothetical protein
LGTGTNLLFTLIINIVIVVVVIVVSQFDRGILLQAISISGYLAL